MSKRSDSPKKDSSKKTDSVPEFRPDDDDDEAHDETYREYHERSDQEGCDDLDAKTTSSNWLSIQKVFLRPGKKLINDLLREIEMGGK